MFGNEKETVLAYLDYHRATLLWKADGLSDEDLRKPHFPSGNSLLGLVKHLAYVERKWFWEVIAGEAVDYPWTDDDPDADWRIEPHETTGQILDLYRASYEHSNEIVRAKGLDEPAAKAEPGRSVRWIVLHMIEETARHNGHADIMRELIDGETGE